VSTTSNSTPGKVERIQTRNNNGFGTLKIKKLKVLVFQEQLFLRVSTKISLHINGEIFQTRDSSMILGPKDLKTDLPALLLMSFKTKLLTAQTCLQMNQTQQLAKNGKLNIKM